MFLEAWVKRINRLEFVVLHKTTTQKIFTWLIMVKTCVVDNM